MSLSHDIKVEQTCGILRLSGRMLSDDGISDVISGVESHIAKGAKNWVCDISGLSYCNSTGLNLFVRILTKSRNAGGDCALIGMQPTVRQLFELSKLNEIFTTCASVEEALGRYNTIA